MTDSLIHRGPDDEGYLIGGPFENEGELPKCDFIKCPYSLAFGHRRLAIVDLSPQGHQPMKYRDSYWIVYNGEIYNYPELRDELEKIGYEFNSHTDTEVIVASYDAWGRECLKKFNGMWAFVIYDVNNKKIFISRDRFGIKPLYYYQDDENFIFASEIKALFKHPLVMKKPNRDYCKMYLEKGPQEHLRETAFEGIYRFDNACFLECAIEEIFRPFKERKFWHVTPNISDEPYNEEKAREYSEKYYQLLDDAVRLRLRADVKVGSALSGGLDSSSIVYLINQHLKSNNQTERQETFSSVYRSMGTEYCDESQFIDTLARALNVKSNQIEPRTEDILKEHEKFVYYLDTPASNTLMSSWHTYKLVKRSGVTVTLDGQGADEQLAGDLGDLTNYFSTIPFSQLFREMPPFLSVPGSLPFLIYGLIKNILIKTIGLKATVSICNFFGKKCDIKPVNKVFCDDLELSLETLFHYADRGSMAFSIESRMPFMDYRLVEFLASVPASYKIHAGWTKYIARKAFDQRLPANICWRKDKMGWPIPEEFWFKNKYREVFFRRLQSGQFLPELGIDFSKTDEKLLFKNYPFDFLMRCYVLETWHSVFWRKG